MDVSEYERLSWELIEPLHTDWTDGLRGDVKDQDEWDKWSYLERDERMQIRQVAENLSAANAEFDYYSKIIPDNPKYDIGRYVADEGIHVPIILGREAVKKALGDGTLMFRSENTQDYDGLPGILSSTRMSSLYKPSAVKLLELLKTDEMSPQEYMELNFWQRDRENFLTELWKFGVPFDIASDVSDMQYTSSVSAWKFIDGINIRLYRDPHAPGRYHYGAIKSEGNGLSAGYIDPDGYDEPIEVGYGPEKLEARKLIEMYEQIRTLPRFDQTAVPLLEMQQDSSGILHFLQYYKTGKRLNEVHDPAPLPSDSVISNWAHGLTPPDGKPVRIYIQPKQYSPGMHGQGVFYESNRQHAVPTILCRICSVYVDDCYISLKGNHASASILHQPGIGISTFGQKVIGSVFSRLEQEAREIPGNAYIEAQVFANGKQASIESDFKLQLED